jgi:hypothetical protein
MSRRSECRRFREGPDIFVFFVLMAAALGSYAAFADVSHDYTNWWSVVSAAAALVAAVLWLRSWGEG